MVNAAKLHGRKLTNTSYRKHLASKLNEKMVPKDIGRHVTGHKNASSLDNYNPLSIPQQKVLSEIVSDNNSISTWSNAATDEGILAQCNNFQSSQNINKSTCPVLMPSATYNNCTLNININQ